MTHGSRKKLKVKAGEVGLNKNLLIIVLMQKEKGTIMKNSDFLNH